MSHSLITTTNPPRRHNAAEGDDLYAIYCEAMEESRRQINDSLPPGSYRDHLLSQSQTVSREQFEFRLEQLRKTPTKLRNFIELLTRAA